MKKVDYKKDYKQLYLPKTSPEILEVPKMPFFKSSGSGDPNGENFVKETEALYSLSYAVKMSYKSDDVPAVPMNIRFFRLRVYGTCLIGQNLRQTKAI